MEPVAEGSNLFLRGFKNPLLSLCSSLSLLQNLLGRSPALMWLGKTSTLFQEWPNRKA